MTSPEATLQQAAENGALDSAQWPATLKYILDRLDEIIADFPKPPVDSTTQTNAESSAQLNLQNTLSQESHTTDKENAPPTTPPRPPVPAFESSSDQASLPPEIITFYSSIRTALTKSFAEHPPHTIQRLAELILEPKKRYRFLPPYLRALDRVVSVSSPLTVFPLPQPILPNAGGLLNGTVSPQASTLGSDESLGGALLTPIPWLQNRGQNELISESTEMVQGPNGAGRIETVTVGMLGSNVRADGSQTSQIASSHPEGETLPSTGPVTQGEILRQEQEAGIVVNNPHTLSTGTTRSAFAELEDGSGVVETVEGEEEPHARGPELIGLEDTGPQKQTGGLDIEGAVGRPSVDRASKSPGVAPAEEAENQDADMTADVEKDGVTDSAEKAAEETADVEMKSDA